MPPARRDTEEPLMPDWFWEAVAGGDPIPRAEVLVTRVVIATLLGFVVALVHRVTVGRRDTSTALHTTLVLLSILIAVITVVIGQNQARAFGLVGALAIVRFRTVVNDTRDTAFVIFAVVLGMAVGAGDVVLAAVAIPAVAFSALILARIEHRRTPDQVEATLKVRLALGQDPAVVIGPALARLAPAARPVATETAKQGGQLELTYRFPLPDPATAAALVNELSRVEGVQGVELRG
jgi:hypothetical protein